VLWIEIAILAGAISLSVDRVVNINVDPLLYEIATRAAPVGDVDVCKRVVQVARDQLMKEWPEFAPPDKSHCLSTSPSPAVKMAERCEISRADPGAVVNRRTSD
jgi:hypothetical protein